MITYDDKSCKLPCIVWITLTVLKHIDLQQLNKELKMTAEIGRCWWLFPWRTGAWAERWPYMQSDLVPYIHNLRSSLLRVLYIAMETSIPKPPHNKECLSQRAMWIGIDSCWVQVTPDQSCRTLDPRRFMYEIGNIDSRTESELQH